jgi:hypothetical protein
LAKPLPNLALFISWPQLDPFLAIGTVNDRALRINALLAQKVFGSLSGNPAQGTLTLDGGKKVCFFDHDRYLLLNYHLDLLIY